MDISSISGLPMVEEPDQYAKSGSQEIDRDAFIKMFLAQMKHQDPLNPMDGSEFAAQLAQFSSLEQLYNVNSTLDGLKTLQETGSRFETLALIGREIVAEGSGISLKEGLTAQGGFELPRGAECSVTVTDSRGLPVREIHLGFLEAGSHDFEWDGKAGSGTTMPDGAYDFKVSAVTQYGEEVKAVPHIRGRVDRVSLQDENSTLYVGQLPVEMASVVDVRNTGSSTSNGTIGDQEYMEQDVGI
ncbi:MAG: flagellar hook assembly protein FlgD [Thermodesulfobacteriota bacterium]